MATILDELIVKLGLDSKDVDSKAPAATKKLKELDESAAGVGESSKAAAAGLSEFSGKLGAFLALLGGTVALKMFVSDVIETNTQLHYLAANLGMTVGELSSWGTVAAEFGGSAKGLEGTLSHLSMEATNFALRGQSSLIPFLSMMGVAFDAAHPEKPLERVAGWVEEAQKSLPRPLIHGILQQMGIDEGTINAMWNGTAALKAYLEQAKKLAPNDAEARHAAEQHAQLVLLDAQFKKVGMDLLEMAAPALEKFLALLERFGAWVKAHETIAEVFAAIALTVGGLAAVVGTLTLAFGALVAIAGVLEIVLPAIGVAFDLMLGPIGLVLAAITAIIAGLAWFETHKTLTDYTAGGDPEVSDADMAHDVAKQLGFYNKVSAKNIPDTAQDIAKLEGFYKQGTIPQRANNPTDIEYGEFAIRHGATGAITAAGGKQIAVFPDVQTGWQAAYEKLGSSSYLGMNQSDAISKWQGKSVPKKSSLLMGHQNDIGAQLAMVQSRPEGAPSTSKNITNHIGAVNVYTQATDAKKMAADLGRGTDWLTFASQANTAVV